MKRLFNNFETGGVIINGKHKRFVDGHRILLKNKPLSYHKWANKRLILKETI